MGHNKNIFETIVPKPESDDDELIVSKASND